jgi:hypothetical protein
LIVFFSILGFERTFRSAAVAKTQIHFWAIEEKQARRSPRKQRWPSISPWDVASLH